MDSAQMKALFGARAHGPRRRAVARFCTTPRRAAARIYPAQRQWLRRSIQHDTRIALLKSCRSATCLVVDLDIPWDFERRLDQIQYKIPELPNVTSLSVKVHPTCERHSIGEGAACLLTRFSNLRYLCLQLNEVPGCLKIDEYLSKDDDAEAAFFCSHEDNWMFRDISLANLLRAEFRGLTGTDCELRFLQFVLESAEYLNKVTGRVDYFLHELFGDDRTWTACEDKSYEWRL
ncbi:hypothetical protein PVAP13_9NG037173 [Panicum virgatum]|uniref:FBD domain-containing protein n=1 Tax=Panicum virgatum TaxID=38727 RepID=A0A8T0MBD8_PANVG|nr:hypothetical protein PVAP13_9NG037173 [Panicum virgatum]